MHDVMEEDIEALWDVLGDAVWNPDVYWVKMQSEDVLDKGFLSAKDRFYHL
jgi:hypothetical protein